MMARARARMAARLRKPPGGDFTAEKKVLLDGQLGHQAELLEYRANADDPGAMRRQIGDLPALIFEGAGVGRDMCRR